MCRAIARADRIDNTKVIEDYHSILIPKAIEYSAGILDYFFRGKIEVTPTWDLATSKYRLHITNKSGQALKGGTFRLFYDHDNGVRTEIGGSNFTVLAFDTIADNGSIDAEFTPGFGHAAPYTLVYKGTIGVSSYRHRPGR